MQALTHPIVLVVDDSSVMRTMLGRALVDAGVPADALRYAANGRIALDLVHQVEPALVVTDVQMPEMTGAELLQALADEGRLPSLPVVVVTSVSSSRDLLSLVRLGAAAVVRKPVDQVTLRQELAPFVAALQPAPEPAPEPLPEPEAGERFVDVDSLLSQRVRHLLEHFGFAPDVAPDEQGMGETRVLFGAALPVARPFAGELRVWAHYEAANRLSLALCGADPGRDDCARLDAVAEILNIVAGDFLMDVTSALGDALNESTFGLPSTFVLGPRTPLPSHAQVLDMGSGDRLAVHVTLSAAEAA